MLIQLKKFGDILTSREAGREALSAFLPTLNSLHENEEIIIDFQGVSVLTPSWADEFIRPIVFLKKYAKKVSLIHDTNPSVQAALRFANPKLDLSTMKVFEDKIVFGEAVGDEIYKHHAPLQVMQFPYSNEEALCILKNNNVKKISIRPVEFLSDRSHLEAVTQMLNQAGIETTMNE